MKNSRRGANPGTDPFGEAVDSQFRWDAQLLGGRFHFDSDSHELLDLARWAFDRLPAQRLCANPPALRVSLRLAPRGEFAAHARPFSGGDLLFAATEPSSFVTVCTQARAAVVVVSPAALTSAYQVRYELLELAVYLLATRAQRLVPLHAGCIGLQGRGLLILGSSGAGKSTTALHGVLRGMEFLAEDSVLIEPASLLATGAGNFLHLRADSLQFLSPGDAAAMRSAPLIRRRSGVEKYEFDVRRSRFVLARAPLRICAVALLTAASGGALLRPLAPSRVRAALAADQPYAAHQPGWSEFMRRIQHLPVFELRRGSHPSHSVDAAVGLLHAAPIPARRRNGRVAPAGPDRRRLPAGMAGR